MLFLLFCLDRDRYMLDAREIAEVLPFIDIMQIPQAPPAVAGIFRYRGTFVPAIDMSQVMLGRPARVRLHTRLIVARYTDDRGAVHLLGLIAEKVTETLQREICDITASGISVPHVAGVTTDRRGLVQKIAVNELLPASVRNLLFHQPTPS